MTEETVIYEFSGVTLNEEKLYKRVVLEKSITITEKQFDELWNESVLKAHNLTAICIETLKKKLGF